MHVPRQWTLVFLMAAFLVARVTGAHLHLCLDGSGPVVELHASDAAASDLGAEHDHPGHDHVLHDSADGHEDVDVDVLGSILAKVAKLDLPALALLVWCLALVATPVMRQTLSRIACSPPYRPPRFLRPLLRAPPA